MLQEQQCAQNAHHQMLLENLRRKQQGVETSPDAPMEQDNARNDDSTTALRATPAKHYFAYKVNICCSGYQSVPDRETVLHKECISREQANHEVERFVALRLEEYQQQHGRSESNQRATKEFVNGLADFRLILGVNGELESRAWVEKELVELAASEATGSEKCRASENASVYFVKWTKIITTAREEPVRDEPSTTAIIDGTMTDLPTPPASENNSFSSDLDNRAKRLSSSPDPQISSSEPKVTTTTDDIDALFSSTSSSPELNETATNGDIDALFSSTHPSSVISEPQQANEPTTTAETGHEAYLHTTISLANRAAKAVFMDWFSPHFTSLEHLAYLTDIDEQMEREIEQCDFGDGMAWDQENEVDLWRDAEHGGRTGAKVKVTERLKVWVEEMEVRGPNNG